MDISEKTAAELEFIALGVILPMTDVFLGMNLCNTKQEAHLLARELSRFLAIIAHDGDLNFQHFSPSGSVDDAWHALIGQPKKYYSLCLALCGEIIDRNPLGGDDIAAKEVQYAATLARYQELFGHVAPENQWPSGYVAATKMAQEITHDKTMPNVPVPEIVNMQIEIRVNEGNTLKLDVKSNDTIQDVKLKIQAKEGISQDQQHLQLCQGRKLENSRTLSYYNIQNDSKIRLRLETEFQEFKHAMMIIR